MIAHPPHGAVDVALERASDMTGIDFQFLLGTAARESGYNPRAQAPTSSAAGLFQFIDQSWLSTLKRHGARYGYARYAALIEAGPDGRYRPRDAQARVAVMGLRLDARAASLMAGEMAADHAQYLRQALGRAPSTGELYAAHFLGAGDTARLVALAHAQPRADAATAFPDAARANPTIFRRDGAPLNVVELYASLTGAKVRMAGADAGSDAFQRYAAARNAERVRLHHAAIQVAVQRRAAPALKMVTPVVAAIIAQKIYTAAPAPAAEKLVSAT